MARPMGLVTGYSIMTEQKTVTYKSELSLWALWTAIFVSISDFSNVTTNAVVSGPAAVPPWLLRYEASHGMAVQAALQEFIEPGFL